MLFPSSTVGMLGASLCGLLILVWWLLLSRAPWLDRLVGVVSLLGVQQLVRPLLDESVRLGGQGFIYFIYSVPYLCLALVLWAVWRARQRSVGRPRVVLVAVLLLACLPWVLLRSEGVSADGVDFRWRWSTSAEERLLASGDEGVTAASSGAPVVGQWPGFRGASRNSQVVGATISTDWEANPPRELWRRAVGPAWSSFSVEDGRLCTQEQRGEEEIVSCYDAASGQPLWKHTDPVRFWEAEGGVGPRGTPTAVGGAVYALGATGILNALDGATGARLWSQDTSEDTETERPVWGYSASPLVYGELVIVAASGRVVAYEAATGDLRWLGPMADESYSSPQLLTLDGVPQIVFQSGAGAVGIDPVDGTGLWEHDWKGFPIVQPAETESGDLLLSVNQQSGLRRLSVSQDAGGWKLDELWTSIRLKPYFSDYVVHGGHAYGFDGSILASIDLSDGKRNWKGGRYGYGQLVLLPDQDLLLVITEDGDLKLVRATPEKHDEIAEYPALEGKTWNHPVVVGDRLYVRNGSEMVAFELPG